MSSIPEPPFDRSHGRLPYTPQTLNPNYLDSPMHSTTAHSFLEREVAVPRLNNIHRHLWIAGQKGHIRPLHKQLMLRREIVITEDPNMHLVWFENTMFLKPLPEVLLKWESWKQCICIEADEKDGEDEMRKGRYFEAACGFLLSYTKLIVYLSDYRMAVERHLIPQMGFQEWCLLSQDLRTSSSSATFVPEKRWEYGELRLSRLNWIYKLTLRGYSYFYIFTEYGPYFGKNFQLLLLAFAYCSVALAAMQVVVSSKDPNNWLVEWCFRFSVVVILFICACLCGILGLVVGLFSYHLIITLVKQRASRKTVQLA